MIVFHEEFKNDVQIYTDLKHKCKSLYPSIGFINNFYLICDKIYTCDKPNVNVVECGVYNGGTLIPVSMYCDTIDKQVNITGIDSFPDHLTTQMK